MPVDFYFNRQGYTMRHGGPAGQQLPVSPASQQLDQSNLDQIGGGELIPQMAIAPRPLASPPMPVIQNGPPTAAPPAGNPNLQSYLSSPGNPPLPRIFEGGIEQNVNDPASRAITSMQDNLLRQGAMRQDLIRQLQGVGGIPGTSEMERQNLRNSMIQQHMRGMGAVQDTSNRGQGIMSNPDYGVVTTADATRDRTSADTNIEQIRARGREAVRAAIVSNGGTAQDVLEAIAAYDAGRPQGVSAGGAHPPTLGQAPSTQVTPPAQAPAQTDAAPQADAGGGQLHRTLDQYLRSAMTNAGYQLPPEAGGGQRGARMPLTLPATGGRPTDAVTNFVTALQGAGLMTPANRAGLHNYMVQRMGPSAVNDWFSQGTANRQSIGGSLMDFLRGGRQSTPHQDSARAMMEYLNQGGAGIGMGFSAIPSLGR